MSAQELAGLLLEDYQPTPSDIAWTRWQYAMMKHGGLWGVPGSQSVWMIDKIKKVFVLQQGDPNHPLNQQIKTVVEAAGFGAVMDDDKGDEDDQDFAE